MFVETDRAPYRMTREQIERDLENHDIFVNDRATQDGYPEQVQRVRERMSRLRDELAARVI